MKQLEAQCSVLSRGSKNVCQSYFELHNGIVKNEEIVPSRGKIVLQASCSVCFLFPKSPFPHSFPANICPFFKIQLSVLPLPEGLPWASGLRWVPHLCLPHHSAYDRLCFFWSRCAACGVLVPWSGIKPRPPAEKAPTPHHWTAREFLTMPFLRAKPVQLHLCTPSI